jgi:hypothetical protein
MSATRFWVAAIIFDLVGMTLFVAGALWEPILLLVGLPFALLGWLLLGLLFYGARLKRSAPERYAGWLWWVNLIAGIAGAALFALPALFVLPALLVLGLREIYWLGALFSGLGLLTGGATAALAAHAIRRRPKFEAREPDDSRWETDAYRRWVEQGGEKTAQGEGRDGT